MATGEHRTATDTYSKTLHHLVGDAMTFNALLIELSSSHDEPDWQTLRNLQENRNTRIQQASSLVAAFRDFVSSPDGRSYLLEQLGEGKDISEIINAIPTLTITNSVRRQ